MQRFETLSLLSEAETADLERGWNLILVNSKHRIPKGYKMELIRLSNGKQVDQRIYPELQKMFDAAGADSEFASASAAVTVHTASCTALHSRRNNIYKRLLRSKVFWDILIKRDGC